MKEPGTLLSLPIIPVIKHFRLDNSQKFRLQEDFEKCLNYHFGNLNLRKIVSDNFGPYEISESSGLRRELYYLRDIGYIHVDSISQLPRKAENLSIYVKPTDTGRKFVSLREKYISNEY